MSSRKNQTTHYQTNIVQVMQNKSIVDRMTFVCTPNECYYLVNGVKVRKENVESQYPTKLVRLDWNKLDPDTRKIA